MLPNQSSFFDAKGGRTIGRHAEYATVGSCLELVRHPKCPI